MADERRLTPEEQEILHRALRKSVLIKRHIENIDAPDDELTEAMLAKFHQTLSYGSRPYRPLSESDYKHAMSAALAVAKRELYERAAKVADERIPTNPQSDWTEYAHDVAETAQAIAARIRGLADER